MRVLCVHREILVVLWSAMDSSRALFPGVLDVPRGAIPEFTPRFATTSPGSSPPWPPTETLVWCDLYFLIINSVLLGLDKQKL